MDDRGDFVRPVTIADVAKLAGVANSTVSRALTQPGRITEATRQRIIAAATELGYRPNLQARSLSSGRKQGIGIVIPDITNPFFFNLIKGAQNQAKAKGYRPFLVDTEESAEVEAGALADLERSVDGVIMAASRGTDQKLIESWQRMPIVLINREVRGIPAVIINTPEGMIQVVDHLVSFGHRRIAYVAGPSSSWSSRKRWVAVERASKRHSVNCVQLGPFTPHRESGAAAADAVLTTGATAAVFFNDLMAIGALQRFVERGIRVPDQISVVGCDDIFGSDFCNPPLTTLTAPIGRTGAVATDMVISAAQARYSRATADRTLELLPTHLTIRESTGPAPRA